MTIKPFRFLLCCLALAYFSCALSPGPAQKTQDDVPAFISEYQDVPFSENTVFFAAPVPEFRPAPGVGIITNAERDLGGSLAEGDRDRLSESFRNAYNEGILRGVQLAGVLGGDNIHGWPPAAPLTWVQNWRNIAGKRNSWGIPDMILAVQGLTHERVFLVQNDILNAYGISAGVGRANGAAGYGAPCGEEFLLDGKTAQSFDKGIITIAADGEPRFIPGDAPSLSAKVPEMVGIFADNANEPLVTGAFQAAWHAELDSGLPPLVPDTPVVKIDLGGAPWMLPIMVSEENILPWGVGISIDRQEATTIAIREIYCQLFDGGKTLFIIIGGYIDHSRGRMAIPPFPRIIRSPFLEVLLNARAKQCEGADALAMAALPASVGGKRDFIQMLLEGIALYGIPLTDAMPWSNAGKTVQVQRFSQGWLAD